MTASAARPTPGQDSGGPRPPAGTGPLAPRLAWAGIALPVFIVAATLCAVAADIDLAAARALWILAAALCATAALIAWADILVVVHRRRPVPRSTTSGPPTENTGPASRADRA
ncbi:hypothetical protein OG948_44830 (plasmid) [Embleya sp. NBC_00888]|uniref:hypothetical protein n=1 Tax=Embleya sp. NBC_00888 TaxID=2975960 RepID=UPI002F90F92E|nr:hypothetical protein OG948_44830 [Embleya sp. NBC_00888]